MKIFFYSCGLLFLFLCKMCFFITSLESAELEDKKIKFKIKKRKDIDSSITLLSTHKILIYNSGESIEPINETICEQQKDFLLCNGAVYTHLRIPFISKIQVGVNKNALTQIHFNPDLDFFNSTKSSISVTKWLSKLCKKQRDTAKTLLIQSDIAQSMPETAKREYITYITDEVKISDNKQSVDETLLDDFLSIDFINASKKDKKLITGNRPSKSVIIYPKKYNKSSRHCNTKKISILKSDQKKGTAKLSLFKNSNLDKKNNLKIFSISPKVIEEHDGVNKAGQRTTTDTGEIKPGSEEYSSYASNYLAQLIQVVTNLRNPKLRKEITLDWILKINELQDNFDALALRFGMEIGISRQLGFFEEDLLERLNAFRTKIKDVIGVDFTLAIDSTATPSIIPGHDLKKDAVSLSLSIDKALEYYSKASGIFPEIIKNKKINAKIIKRLKEIQDKIATNPNKIDKYKHEVFVVFAELEKEQSLFTNGLSSEHKDYEMFTESPWVEELTPRLKLERLQDSAFKLQTIGAKLSKRPQLASDAKVFKYAIKTNIPGIFIGFNDNASFFGMVDLYSRTFSIKDGLIKKVIGKQLFIAGELKQLNSREINELYGVKLKGGVIGKLADLGEQGARGVTTSFVIDKDYRESHVKLSSSLSTEEEIPVQIHELIHFIDNAAFADGFHVNARSFYVQLTPNIKLKWSSGDDERLAVGTRFLGDVFASKQSRVPAIGWIAENTYNYISEIAPRLFYPKHNCCGNAVPTYSMYIPQQFISDVYSKVTFSKAASFFSNLKKVYIYLNDLQEKFQRLRILIKVINDSQFSHLINSFEKEKIEIEIQKTQSFLDHELPKIAQAVTLAEYMKIRDKVYYPKVESSEDARSVLYIQTSLMKFAALFIVQFRDFMPESFTKKFIELFYDEIPKQYTNVAVKKYGLKNAKEQLKIKENSNPILPVYPETIGGFSDIHNPFGLSVMDHYPDIASKENFEVFAKQLGVPDGILEFQSGTFEDYNVAISFFVDHLSESDRKNSAVITTEFIKATEDAIYKLMANGGEGESIAKMFLHFFEKSPVADRRQLMQLKEPLFYIAEILSIGEKSIGVDLRAQLKTIIPASTKEQLPVVSKYKITEQGKILHLTNEDEVLQHITNVTFQQPIDGYYPVIPLSDGSYLFISKDKTKNSSFLVSKAFVQNTQWLDSEQILSSPENISSSIAYFEHMQLKTEQFSSFIVECYIKKMEEVIYKLTITPTNKTHREVLTKIVNQLASLVDKFTTQKQTQSLNQLHIAINDLFSKFGASFIPEILVMDDYFVQSITKICGSLGLTRSITQAGEFYEGLAGIAAVSLNIINMILKRNGISKIDKAEAAEQIAKIDVSKFQADQKLINQMINLYYQAANNKKELIRQLSDIAHGVSADDSIKIKLLKDDKLCEYIQEKLPQLSKAKLDSLTRLCFELIKNLGDILNNLSKGITDFDVKFFADLFIKHPNIPEKDSVIALLVNTSVVDRQLLKAQFNIIKYSLISKDVPDIERLSELARLFFDKHSVDALSSITVNKLKEIILSDLQMSIVLGISKEKTIENLFTAFNEFASLKTFFKSQQWLQSFIVNIAEAFILSEENAAKIGLSFADLCSCEHIVWLKNTLQNSSAEIKLKTLQLESLVNSGLNSVQMASYSAYTEYVISQVDSSMKSIREQHNLSDSWIPLLSSVKDTGSGIELTVIDADYTDFKKSSLTIDTMETSFLRRKKISR